MTQQIEHHPDDYQTLEANWDAVAYALEWFTCAMEDKFARVAHKGHWYYVTQAYLERRLEVEIAELHAAIMAGGNNPMEVIGECVDVANCALMLADFIRLQSQGMPE